MKQHSKKLFCNQFFVEKKIGTHSKFSIIVFSDGFSLQFKNKISNYNKIRKIKISLIEPYTAYSKNRKQK